jgi:hypothetical protein
MAQDFDNTNRGSLFVNDRKETDKHPDRTGSINVEGVDYWLSGWLKESASGKKYMSLSITKKEKQTGKATKPVQHFSDDFDDEIPF